MPGKIVLANPEIRLESTPVVGMLVRLCTSSFTRSALDDAFKVKRKNGEFRVVRSLLLLAPTPRTERKSRKQF